MELIHFHILGSKVSLFIATVPFNLMPMQLKSIDFKVKKSNTQYYFDRVNDLCMIKATRVFFFCSTCPLYNSMPMVNSEAACFVNTINTIKPCIGQNKLPVNLP